MRNLHEKLQGVKDVDDMEFEDDLPSFLLSMSSEELNELICDIARNIVSKADSKIKFYTVHSYKGMEDDIIRVANDVTMDDDANLYYVALTRGLKKICMDEGSTPVLKTDNTILDFLMDSNKPVGRGKTKVPVKKVAPKVETGSKIKLWSSDEVSTLLTLAKEGKLYDDIAVLIGRSSLAVELRLRKIGADMVINDGKSLEEVLELTKLDRVSLEESIDQERIKAVATNKGVRWDEKEINKVLGLIKTGTPINKIAIMCGRSVGSIKEKLFEQAGKYGILGFGVDEIMRITGLPAIEVNTAIVAAKRKAED